MAAVFCGCGAEEQDRTVVLPPLENHVIDLEKFRIDHIQQYIGSGYAENVLCLAWGDPGTDMLCLLKKEDGGYIYQAIDTGDDTVLSSIFVDDRSLANVSIAPGGGYLSYEVQDGEEMKLIVFCPGQKTWQILHRWEGSEETFSYIWSDDGTMLFSWQNGDTGDAYKEWQVTRYEMEADPKDGFQCIVVRFQMKGNGPAWRSVCPNADGSEIYVREQLSTFGSSMSNEWENGVDGVYTNYDVESNMTAAEVMGESPHTCNWMLLPDTVTAEALPEYSETAVYPVRYTQAGLFVQEENGDLYLIRDIRSQPVKTKLISGKAGAYDPSPCVCVNGDHVFLMEWINYSMYQISGVHIVDGKADGQPVVLYKDNYESLNQIKIVGDQAVVFWGDEFLENNGYRYKVTVLRY
ncbi:MAG: hypothetical protein K2G19_06340 [Lachnospiraceae bacterium]|nr:hypothetical protein [Lachnospiraceae bacterium]